ncbi:MAG TPA: AsmA family protein [Gammaproteobacteria bacterium]|nr:AsmA family protein [Gammaproteobacteria bacterium]
MNRTLQIILGLFALIVVLVLAAVILIPLLVDPNDYREEIAQAVEEETGRSFEIEGELSLSVFPWLGLEVGRMRLGNPPGFDAGAFVEIGSAAVGAKLMPLLSRRLEVSTLRLDGLRVNLVRLADGTTNWEGLGGDDVDEPASLPPARDGGEFRLERIAGLRVTDAAIRFEDRQAGTVTEVAIPALSTGELAPGAAFPLEAEATVALDDGATQLMAKLAGTVSYMDEGPSFEIEGLELDIEGSGPGIPGGSQGGTFTAPRATADLGAQTLSIPALTLSAAGVHATGEVTGTRIVDAPAFAGRVAIEEFSPRALIERLGEPVPDTADGGVLGKGAFEARFQGGSESVELDGLRLQLDDTTLTGTAGIGFGDVTRVRAGLQLDAIDLDRYLPPEPDEPVEPEPVGDVPLAFDWLDGLDLDATFTAGRLKVNGLTLTDVEGRAVARDGVLTLQPFGAALYGGKVRGSARLDARTTPATLSLEQSLSALQLLPFVQDLADFDRLTGVAQLGAKLTTSASSTAGLMSGLNGDLSFDVSDGALKGVNLWFEIQRAYALAKGRPVPERTSPDTDFRQLKGTAVIRDGRLVNEDLVGGLPFLGLTGRGEVDLAEAAVDYRLDATVIRQAIDEATGEVSELAGLSVPLRLAGALDSPSVRVDVSGLLKDRAEQEALRKLGLQDEEGKSAEDQLKERALDKVRGLRDRLRRED